MSASSRSSRSSTLFAAACTVAVGLTVLLARWLGPHDLYEKDQPKTMAYTADIVRNHRLALPRDVIYQPATKPPMYNWIDAAFVAASGSWGEWTLKLPSTLGVLATGAIVYAMGRRAAGDHDRRSGHAAVIGLLAVGVWFTFGSDIRHGSVLRLSYLARPDMLLTAFCTAVWACFTIAVDRPSVRRAGVPAVGGWLCVAAAALTKGPAAALPLLFAFVYAMLGGGPRNTTATSGRDRFPSAPAGSALESENFASPAESVAVDPNRTLVSRVLRLWLPVGLPILALCVGGWLYAAYRQNPVHVRDVIWGAEVAHRLTETPEGFKKPFYFSAMWFVTKAQPWGVLALLGLAAVAALPRLRGLRPAALYLLIVLIGLSIPAAKRQDYLLPAYAPAAVLVAGLLADFVRHRVLGVVAFLGVLGLIALTLATGGRRPVDWALPIVGVLAVVGCLLIERRRAVPLAILTAVPLLLAGSMAYAFHTKFFEAKHRWSDHAVAFVEQVRARVHPDQSLLVIVRGKHPLTTLLGRHQGSYLTPADLRAASFVILPEQADLKADLLSDPLPEGFAELENRPLVRLGLYRGVPVDRLVAAQKACGEWTTVENPYHAPGTVFRGE